MYDIPHATNAIAEFLQSLGTLSDDALDAADNILITIWRITNPQLRIHIIQDAAIQAGLLSAEDID